MELFAFENIIKTYKYVAYFSTILFVIKFIIFSFVGGDSEVSCDFNDISDTDTSFNFLSIQSVLAFLMGFGWIGLASLTQWHVSAINSIICSVVCGLIFMFVSAYLMLKIKSFNQINEINYKECIGTICRAYTRIYPNSEGQIEIEINGKLTIKNAVNFSDIEIQAFEQIKVVKVENEKLYVEKV